MLGGCAKRTSTLVPPRKSIPYLMPPLRKMADQPMSSKRALNPKKYLALPIQSILGCLKSSIMPFLRFPSLDSMGFRFVPDRKRCKHLDPVDFLNAEFRLTIHLGQVILEDGLGHKDGSEHVRNQTDRQGDRETTDWAGSKDEEEDGRNNRGHVGINNGQKRLIKTGIHGRRGGLPIAQFFADAFED